jgi:hypothetical protein
VLRPPVAQERVEQRAAGLVGITLKKAYADGKQIQAIGRAPMGETRR